MKKSFVLYTDMYDSFKNLPLLEKGRLLDSIYLYAIDGTITKLKPESKMAFSFIKREIDRNSEKWNNIVRRNIENGKKGGRPRLNNNPKEPRKPIGLIGNPKNLVNVNVNDNDIAAAVAEILSIKGNKASMRNGQLFAHNKPVNNPIAYLEVLKQNEPPNDAPQLRQAKQLTDQELKDFFKGKHIGETEGIPEDYVYEAMERKIL